jgi:membrane associated rhomboid family serine protease
MNLNIGADADSKVDNWGHLGGFITGFLAGFAIAEFFDCKARSRNETPDRFTDEEY